MWQTTLNVLIMNKLISVGIPTAGPPVFEKNGEYTILRNMIIGKDFHWQRSLQVLLPGEIEITGDPVYTLINRLPLETYLECVVGSEMNPNAPAEFLKAHSVISRSWALGKILKNYNASNEGKIFSDERIINWEDTCDHLKFDVCSDDHCQRYQGYQPYPAPIRKALEQTRGEVLLTPSGKIVDARFSKCCGGQTEIFSTCWQDHEEECLESFEDPYCNLDNLSESKRRTILGSILKFYDLETQGGYRWDTVVLDKHIKDNLLTKFNRDIGNILDLKVISTGKSGRIKELEIVGDKGNLRLGKELMIRRLLDDTHLFSSRFKIVSLNTKDRIWSLIGRGWGHGVGLCQIGAARMALEGFNYKDILHFYYPGAIITKNY